MPQLRIQLFTSFSVSVDGYLVPATAWRGRSTQALLQFLALRSQSTAAVDEILSALWPHLPVDKARQNLYVTVNRLRRALSSTPAGEAPDLVQATANGYRLCPGSEVDLQSLQRLVRHAPSLQGDDTNEALSVIGNALIPDPDTLLVEQPYADWAIAARERWRQEFIALLVIHGNLLAEHRQLKQALACLLRVLELEPVREAVARRAMQLAYDVGDQVLALEIFDRCRRALSEELGIDPMAETVALHARLLMQPQPVAAAVAAAPPSPSGQSTPTALFARVEALLAVEMEEPHRLDCYPADVRALVTGHYQALVVGALEAHDADLTYSQGVVLARFRRAADAAMAACRIQSDLYGADWPVRPPVRARIAVHAAGQGEDEGDRTLALMALAHGGQTLLSAEAADQIGARMPDGTLLRPLGIHRLRDLFAVESLFALVQEGLPDQWPPLRSLDNVRHNLPLQQNRFIGRRREMSDIEDLLRGHRLVTLHGPGGSGKTRLSLQAGALSADRWRDGVWFVPLASIRDKNVVAQAVASVLGVKEEPRRPLVETLCSALRDRELLLILDNCEHLASTVAALADLLLAHCPGVRMLATSQRVLAVTGEKVWRAPSLELPEDGAVPSPHAVKGYEAVRFFLARARQVQPSLALTSETAGPVVAICRVLDGMPLALELAAAQLRRMALPELAERLTDRFRLLAGGTNAPASRHQTLRAAMDWSFGLLDRREQAVWRRLSVFAGSFVPGAAQEVCAGGDVSAGDVPAVLQALEDCAVVVREEDVGVQRYRLLETIREYGEERLKEAGEHTDLATRHRDWYLRFAEEAETHLRGPEQGAWLERMQVEIDNLRLALHWSRQSWDVEAGLRMAGALGRFWERRGYAEEGRSWFTPLLRARGPDRPRARALIYAARLAHLQGDYDAADAYLSECLHIQSGLKDDLEMARTLNSLGNLAREQGDYETAIGRYEEGLALVRSLDKPWDAALVLNNLCVAYRGLDDYEQAEQSVRESLALFRRLGDKWGVALALNNLAMTVKRAANWDEAEELLAESLALHTELQNGWGIAQVKANLGAIKLSQGDLEAASELMLESLRCRLGLGNWRGAAVSLEGVGWTLAASGEMRRAALLLGAAAGQRRSIGFPLAPEELDDHCLWTGRVRGALGESIAESLMGEGLSLSLEQACNLALGEDPAVRSSVRDR